MNNLAVELEDYINSFDVDDKNLQNGFLGYTAYDAVQVFESVSIQESEKCVENIQDMCYIL